MMTPPKVEHLLFESPAQSARTCSHSHWHFGQLETERQHCHAPQSSFRQIDRFP